MIPLRGVFEKMGADLKWFPDQEQVRANCYGHDLRVTMDDRTAYVDGRRVVMDTPATMVGDRAMVPIRFFGESFGTDVVWRENTVYIKAQGEVPSDGRLRTEDRQARRDRMDDNRDGRQDRDDRRDARNDRQDRTTNGRMDDPSRTRRQTSNIRPWATFLTPNTVIPVILNTDVTSANAVKGDTVSADLSSDGAVAYNLPVGTTFSGKVAAVSAMEKGKPGMLAVEFNRVTIPGQGTYAFAGSATAITKNEVIERDGKWYAKNTDNKQIGTFVGIGAGAGYVFSQLTRTNPLIDTLLGGGIGYLLGQKPQYKDVSLSKGDTFGIRVESQQTL